MKRIRIVVWGGSAIAMPEFVDVLRKSLLPSEAVDLVLVGRTPEKLRVVGDLCVRLAQAGTADLQVSYTTDTEAALSGADYVLSQIRPGGLSARSSDESFPRDLGVPGEETLGPGGFASALRTIPVVLEHCRLAERVCPDVTIVNMTNPASIVQYAMLRHSPLHTIGICDVPITLMQLVAQTLELPYDELEFDYVGMNHLGWVTGVRRRGYDLLPLTLERAERMTTLGVDPQLIRQIGAIPNSHYRFFFHPERILAQTIGKRTRAEELIAIQAELEVAYARPDAHLRPDLYARRKANWYKTVVVPLFLNLMRDSRQLMVPNVRNGSAIPWLPADAIVEVPCVVGASGARPLSSVPVPPDVMTFLQVNCAYEMLAADAIVEQSRDKALRALRLNPMLRSVEQARATLEKVWPA